MRKFLKRSIEWLTNSKLYRELPPGIDVFADILKYYPNENIKTVFDVGAHTGGFTNHCMQYFPKAKYHLFEPVPDNIKQLKQTFQKPNVSINSRAVAATEANQQSFELGQSFEGKLGGETSGNKLLVDVISLDGYCSRQNISHIDYLKIDAEGHDLDVLKGAKKLLDSGSVKYIEVEAGMNRENTDHAYFEEFVRFLEPYGYKLFKIYDQMHEWKKRKPYLRRGNLVFVNTLD